MKFKQKEKNEILSNAPLSSYWQISIFHDIAPNFTFSQKSSFFKYICNFLDQLLHPYKSYGRDMSGILFFIFASCESLRGYCPPGPYFWRLCAFSQKIKQLRTKYPIMDLVRNVPRNSKITVLLQWRPLLWSYSQICAKINIFHVLNHKSITTWVSEIPMQ